MRRATFVTFSLHATGAAVLVGLCAAINEGGTRACRAVRGRCADAQCGALRPSTLALGPLRREGAEGRGHILDGARQVAILPWPICVWERVVLWLLPARGPARCSRVSCQYPS